MMVLLEQNKQLYLASAEIHHDRILLRKSVGELLQLHWNDFLAARFDAGQHVEYSEPAVSFCRLPSRA